MAWAACAAPGVAPGRARARKIPAPRAAAVPASGGEAPLRRELPRLPRFVGKKELALPKGARFRRGIPCPSSGRSQDTPSWIWFHNKVSLSLSLSRARVRALSGRSLLYGVFMVMTGQDIRDSDDVWCLRHFCYCSEGWIFDMVGAIEIAEQASERRLAHALSPSRSQIFCPSAFKITNILPFCPDGNR